MPYLGYWQLLGAVDVFVIYDDIQFTKNGWIQRNRFLKGDTDSLFTLPIKKDSDYLDIKDRYLAEKFEEQASKITRQLSASYKKAPNYGDVMPMIEQCLQHEDRNLFRYIHNSIRTVAEYLGIDTPIVVSSSTSYDKSLRGQEKVLNLCAVMNATSYLNPIGGVKLYDKELFASSGIDLSFLEMRKIEYPQFNKFFISALSIIDVMMFNDVKAISKMLREYDIR